MINSKWTRPWTRVTWTKWTIASINQLVSRIQMKKKKKIWTSSSQCMCVSWFFYLLDVKIERDREKSIELTLWLGVCNASNALFTGVCSLTLFFLPGSSSVIKICAGLITSIGQMSAFILKLQHHVHTKCDTDWNNTNVSIMHNASGKQQCHHHQQNVTNTNSNKIN